MALIDDLAGDALILEKILNAAMELGPTFFAAIRSAASGVRPELVAKVLPESSEADVNAAGEAALEAKFGKTDPAPLAHAHDLHGNKLAYGGTRCDVREGHCACGAWHPRAKTDPAIDADLERRGFGKESLRYPNALSRAAMVAPIPNHSGPPAVAVPIPNHGGTKAVNVPVPSVDEALMPGKTDPALSAPRATETLSALLAASGPNPQGHHVPSVGEALLDSASRAPLPRPVTGLKHPIMLVFSDSPTGVGHHEPYDLGGDPAKNWAIHVVGGPAKAEVGVFVRTGAIMDGRPVYQQASTSTKPLLELMINW